MRDEVWPDDHADPLQQEFKELITGTVARIRSGEVAIEIAVVEAADSEFARMYEMSPGFIEHHVSSALGASEPRALATARR